MTWLGGVGRGMGGGSQFYRCDRLGDAWSCRQPLVATDILRAVALELWRGGMCLGRLLSWGLCPCDQKQA